MPGPRPLIKMRARFNKHAPQKYGIVLQNKVGRPAEVVIQVGKYVHRRLDSETPEEREARFQAMRQRQPVTGF